MALTESGRLFDITLRLALFVENIKLGQMREFNAVLAAVDEELRKLLNGVKYSTLDGLSKAELNRLLVALRRSQTRIYSAYSEKLIESLQEFMQLRLDVSAIAFASVKHSFDNNGEPLEFDEDEAYDYIEDESEQLPFSPLFGLAAILPGGKTSLWSAIKNAPIPANGLYVLPFIQTFGRSAQASVENTIRKAWANKVPVQKLIAELSGERSPQGRSTQFAKIKAQANAVIETAFSHVDQISSQAITSALFNQYIWVSVIDSATTDVCLDRNGKVYRYGQGPIPPAHYRCRSTTAPLWSQLDDFSPPTLYAWLKKQSTALQREFLSADAVSALNKGELTAKDFAHVVIGRPLELNKFKSKTGLILQP